MQARHPFARTLAEAGLTLLLMAAVPIFIKFTQANAYTIGVFRLSVAAVLAFILFGVVRHLRSMGRRHWWVLVATGLVFGLHWLLYFISIKKATPSIAILGMSSYGIHLIFLGWAFRGQVPTVFDGLAVLVAVLGIYLLVPVFSFESNITLGLFLGIVSGFFFALLPVIHQRNADLPNGVRSFGQYTFALLVFLPMAGQTEWQLRWADWGGLLYLAIAGTFVAHSLWVRVTTRLPTTTSSLIFYLTVPMTMVMSYFFLGEQFTPSRLGGAACIIAANCLGLLSRRSIKS